MLVMENLDLTQLVHDRKMEREADAHDHRLTKSVEAPVSRQPRLRYERRHRTPAISHRSLANG